MLVVEDMLITAAVLEPVTVANLIASPALSPTVAGSPPSPLSDWCVKILL